MSLLLIGLSGSFGALSRFALSIWLIRFQGEHDFPLPILIINVSGSLILGLLHAHLGVVSEGIGLILSTGFLGAFTTFSTFSMESFNLIRHRKWKALSWYISLTIVGSILAYSFGYYIL